MLEFKRLFYKYKSRWMYEQTRRYSPKLVREFCAIYQAALKVQVGHALEGSAFTSQYIGIRYIGGHFGA